MGKIRILICDDMVGVCEGYRMHINMEKDFECIGTSYCSEDCAKMMKELKPDVLLLDIQMETETTGIDIIPQLKELSPDTKIIMLTSYGDGKYIFLALLNGADGYVVKSAYNDKLFQSIREICNDGNSYFKLNSEIMEAFKSEAKNVYNSRNSLLFVMDQMVKLSIGEYEILKDIYNNKTYKTIANERVVEECTIKTTASRILKKFEVESMKELKAILKELRLFDSI